MHTPPHAPAPLPYLSMPPVPGPPPVRSGQSRNAVLGVVAAGVTVLAVVATIAFFNRSTTSGDASAATYQQPVAAPTDVTEYTPDELPATDLPTETETETPTAEPTAPAVDLPTALAELRLQLDADRPMAEALVDQWVPQLSAKRPGLVVNGVNYNYLEILRDFRQTQARYPDALLLFSGEYSSFKYGNFWITVVPRPQYDGASANVWCDGEGIGPDDCYAKMISHTEDYDGATLLRGQ
jgi:hypothetical protein